MRQPIKKVSLQSEITKYILDYIKEEKLQCGDKLPSQSELMEMMGVSRTSLREAMRVMEGQGLLSVVNGKGVYVGKQFQEDFIQKTLSFHWEKAKMLEALEVRSVIEKEILKMVIRRITDQEIDELGQLTKDLMEKFRKGIRTTAEDKAFHLKIYSCCHNSVMSEVIVSMQDAIAGFWQEPLEIEKAFDESMPYHETLYEAIRDRDLRRAIQANDEIAKYLRRDIEAANIK